MFTTTDIFRIATTFVLATCLGTSVAHADGRFGPAPVDDDSASESASPEEDAPIAEQDEEAPPSVEEALETGDLQTALEQVRVRRQADPSPENWRQEARILEQMGHYEAAAEAYAAELEALPEGADEQRKTARDDRDRMHAAARGTVADEPPSKHREQLDERWAPQDKPERARPTRPEPGPPQPSDERIVRKWYFWVTVLAITASAAAVTGIAIKAARDRRRDALDLQRTPNAMGPPPLFRF